MKKDENAEIWKTIEEFPEYEVSSFGNVRGPPRLRGSQSRVLMKQKTRFGYKLVGLWDREAYKQFNRFVHVLVAKAFIGEKPSTKHQVAHGDGTRSNNFVENLRWATSKENCDDRRIHGTEQIGESHARAKLKEEDVRRIVQLCALGVSSKDIQNYYNLSQGIVRHIICGIRWPHLYIPEREQAQQQLSKNRYSRGYRIYDVELLKLG